jgi:hypothetical protein
MDDGARRFAGSSIAAGTPADDTTLPRRGPWPVDRRRPRDGGGRRLSGDRAGERPRPRPSSTPRVRRERHRAPAPTSPPRRRPSTGFRPDRLAGRPYLSRRTHRQAGRKPSRGRWRRRTRSWTRSERGGRAGARSRATRASRSIYPLRTDTKKRKIKKKTGLARGHRPRVLRRPFSALHPHAQRFVVTAGFTWGMWGWRTGQDARLPDRAGERPTSPVWPRGVAALTKRPSSSSAKGRHLETDSAAIASASRQGRSHFSRRARASQRPVPGVFS